MKKYFLVIALCAIQIVHTACAEKYTVHDLYALYDTSKDGHIVTQEMRDDLPYYKKMMSDYVTTLEHQHLMACQEGVKSAAVAIFTAAVVAADIFKVFNDSYYLLHFGLDKRVIKKVTGDVGSLAVVGIAVPFAADYFKHGYAYKKRTAEQYEVGKKILAQLEEYECSIEQDQKDI